MSEANTSAEQAVPARQGIIMTEKELLELIGKGEGQTLEFKDTRIHPRSLAETLAAFAAADGGIILIGVADNSGILGVSNFEQVRDNLIYEAAGRNHCEPQIQPIEVEKIEIGLTQLKTLRFVVRRFIAVKTRNELRYYQPAA